MTVEQKAASLLMLHAPGIDPAPLRSYIDAGVSGLILMGDNMRGRRGIADLPHGGDDRRHRAAAAVRRRPGGRRCAAPRRGTRRRAPAHCARCRPPMPRAAPSPPVRRASQRAASNVNFGIVADVTADPGLVHLRPRARHRSRGLGRAGRRGGRGGARSRREHAQALPRARCGAGRLALEHPGCAALDRRVARRTGASVRRGHRRRRRARHDGTSRVSRRRRRAGVALARVASDPSRGTRIRRRRRHGRHAHAAAQRSSRVRGPGRERGARRSRPGSDLLLYVLPADPSEFGISVDGLVASIVAAVEPVASRPTGSTTPSSAC